ncbi:SLATT domain-containing protein [Streptomyces sp. NPDC090088]|uniref:SLATT domain-containing protein n=1 Tax=Streptomyces sp. NPDC090088 TaxID=3365944 RepID=UPI00382D3E14
MVVELFTLAESYVIDTSIWYLERRISPSRKSKLLRAVAAVSVIIGAVLPLIHSAAPALVSAEWGFVFLALGGGAVLFDRVFGYSASWTRYIKAGLLLQQSLADAQIKFSRAYLSVNIESPTGQEINSLLDIVSALRGEAGKAVEDETNSWTGYISESVEELTRSTGRGASISVQAKSDR